MPRHQATPIRRAPGCLWAKAGWSLGTLGLIGAASRRDHGSSVPAESARCPRKFCTFPAKVYKPIDLRQRINFRCDIQEVPASSRMASRGAGADDKSQIRFDGQTLLASETVQFHLCGPRGHQ